MTILASLHRRAYQHKTSKIVEHMLVEALIAANPFITIPGKSGPVKMSEAISDMVCPCALPCMHTDHVQHAYTLLTDDIISVIQMSSQPELAPARAIIDKIHHRYVDLLNLCSSAQPSQKAVQVCRPDPAGPAAPQALCALRRFFVDICRTVDSCVQDRVIATEVFSLMNELGYNSTGLTLDDIIVHIVQLDYGMNVRTMPM